MTWDEYQEMVVSLLDRNIKKEDNPQQHQAIRAPPSQSQFIVAGPGSGKTTVMVLKILKFILVDNVPPSSILATTFTKKAASELTSRIISWGNKMVSYLLEHPQLHHLHPHLESLKLDETTIGTLDSIAEDFLGNPHVIEESVSRSLMMQKLFEDDLEHNSDLLNYLKSMKSHQGILGVTGMSEVLLEIKDRIFHDQVDLDVLQKEEDHPGCQVACQLIANYLKELDKRKLYDFVRLESELLNQIKKGHSRGDDIKIILVDEYQDTNLLQESIYFELAKKAIENGGSLTVVGDDDQSLYRFRGATVDLFTQYQWRIKQHLKIEPHLINLSWNYRSTPSIVDFTNSFLEVDEDYQYARVRNKPPIKTARKKGYTDYPVLGMFRPDRKTLAQDLTCFITQCQTEEGYQVHKDLKITINQGDCSLLMSSPREFSSHSAKLFPHYLRQHLQQEGWEVFNPRGESLERVESTELLAGILLEVLDSDKSIENSMSHLPSKVKSSFHKWRKTVKRCKDPALDEFLYEWKNNKKQIHLLELFYELLNWIPDEDQENQVRLEAITRTIKQTSLFAAYHGLIIPQNEDSSREIFWNVLVPLATGAIEVDEELLLDRDLDNKINKQLNIMSIHQAKGLEFSLVVVDVGSDYSKIHRSHAYKRFPLTGDASSHLEDQLRAYSPLGEAAREKRDRAFDDVIRQYFVAFSRPQNVLLVIGLNAVRDGYQVDDARNYIPNVATGWDRNGQWHWRGLDNLFMI